MSDRALVVEGIYAGYGDLTVLRDVSLRVRGGDLLVLAGPNGAGKTTLLATIMGMVKPSSGSVTLGGRELLGRPIYERTQMGVGLVPEGRGLFPGLTVWENLRVAAKAARLDSGAAEAGIAKAVEAFPVIGERMGQDVHSLSGGEQQMVAFGRALLTDPSVLLLDEPSMGLAPVIVQQLFDLVRRIRAEGYTVLIVEQNVSQVLKVADRAYLLEVGRIVQSGSSAELAASDEIRKAYMGI